MTVSPNGAVPVLSVYRLGGSGFIVQYGATPYAKEDAVSTAELVRQLLVVGTQGVRPTAELQPTPAPLQRPVVAPQAGAVPEGGEAVATEYQKQERNLERLVQARITGAIGDQEFTQHVGAYCPLLSIEYCLDALDRGMIDEPPLPGTPGTAGMGGMISTQPEDDFDQPQTPRNGVSVKRKVADTPGMLDFGPQDIASMVADYVTDDLTGAVLPDGS